MTKTIGQKMTGAFLLCFAVLVALILYTPLITSVVYSLVPQSAGKLQWAQPTIEWYFKLWDDQLIVSSIKTTLVVGVVGVAAASILGVSLALYTTSSAGAGRWLVELLVFMPFLLPPIITGISLLIYFESLGIPRGVSTMAVGHTVFVLAIIYRLVADRLLALPPSLVEAAADLGATRAQTFRFVVWPLISPVVVTASVLAFALSFDETLITAFIAGTEMTLPIRLWSMMRVGFTPAIYALVTIIIVASAVLVVVVARRLNSERGYAD